MPLRIRFAAPARAGVSSFIETVPRPLLVSQDLLDRRHLWRRMRSVLTGRTGGMLIEAIAGVDIALWDLAGHCAGQSIAQLLGGMGRRTTPVYASSINWFDGAAVEREVANAVTAGFRRIKVKIGRPVGDAIELSVDANWANDLHDAADPARRRRKRLRGGRCA